MNLPALTTVFNADVALLVLKLCLHNMNNPASSVLTNVNFVNK